MSGDEGDAQHREQLRQMHAQLQEMHEQRHGQRLAQRRKQQREEDRAELQQVILDVARNIAVQEGWPAVTIRRIADEIGYSAANIYEYFASKEEILIALKKLGFQQMYEAWKEVWEREADPRDQLVATMMTQWDFAWSHLELFQVMYSIGGVRCGTDTPIERKEVYMAVRDKMATMMAAAGAKVASVEDAMLICQSTLIGLIMQVMNDRIPGGHEHARKMLRQAAEDYLVAWGANR